MSPANLLIQPLPATAIGRVTFGPFEPGTLVKGFELSVGGTPTTPANYPVIDVAIYAHGARPADTDASYQAGRPLVPSDAGVPLAGYGPGQAINIVRSLDFRATQSDRYLSFRTLDRNNVWTTNLAGSIFLRAEFPATAEQVAAEES